MKIKFKMSKTDDLAHTRAFFVNTQKNYCRVECTTHEDAMTLVEGLNFAKVASGLEGGKPFAFNVLMEGRKKDKVKIENDLETPLEMLKDLGFINDSILKSVVDHLSAKSSIENQTEKTKKSTSTQGFFSTVSSQSRASEAGVSQKKPLL